MAWRHSCFIMFFGNLAFLMVLFRTGGPSLQASFGLPSASTWRPRGVLALLFIHRLMVRLRGRTNQLNITCKPTAATNKMISPQISALLNLSTIPHSIQLSIRYQRGRCSASTLAGLMIFHLLGLNQSRLLLLTRERPTFKLAGAL